MTMKRGLALALALLIVMTPLGVFASDSPSYPVSNDRTLSTGLRFSGVYSANLGYGWVQAQFIGPLPWFDGQILIQNHVVTYLQFALRSPVHPSVFQQFQFVHGRVTMDTLSDEGRLLVFMMLANFWPEGFPAQMADDPLLILGIYLGQLWAQEG
jgi:hypothetical protein